MRSGWEAVNAALASAQAEIAAVAPDAETAAEGEAYVLRMLTACLNDALLGHLFVDGGLSRALPTRGCPNPDYLMSHAPIDPARRYRIEGQLNASERIGVGLYSIGQGGSVVLSDYAAFDSGSAGAHGRFALDIAADAKSAGALVLKPDVRVLMVRTLHRDPNGAPARVTLSGRPPISDLTLAGGDVDAALAQAARMTLSGVRQFLEWSAVMSAAPNRFLSETPNLSQGVQGDPDTIYYLGYYALGAGEWLEATLPSGLKGYWSLHAYNHWCEALPGAGIGDDVAAPDADGRMRIVIGPAPPLGAPNRIDTHGRKRGALVCRFVGARDVSVPETFVRRAAGA